MRLLTRVVVVLFAFTVIAPRAARADERVAPALSEAPIAWAQGQSAPDDSEKRRKAGLTKIIIGSIVAGVGAIVVATAEYKTTLTYVNGRLVDDSTSYSGAYWGGFALAGAGAALIVVGARQRINADQQGIVIPLGGEWSRLVVKPGRRSSVAYGIAW